MGRKRFNHAVEVFCSMFCGWKLMNSFRELVSLGAGTLHIDILTGSCLFEGKMVAPISIGEEIKAWFEEDIERFSIPREIITRAELIVEIDGASVVPKVTTGKYFFNPNGKVGTKYSADQITGKLLARIESKDKQYVHCREFMEAIPQNFWSVTEVLYSNTENTNR